MNIHAYRDILSGVYSINPMQIPFFEHMLYALRNGFEFDGPSEMDEFKSFLQETKLGSAATTSGQAPQATKIAVHSQRSVILRDDMGCGHVGTRTIGNRMLQADADADVMAQIIWLDTPGGDSRAFEEIRDAKAKCNKPVYAFVDVMCCSAGMHIASFCDEIYAHRATDIVGSIGTYAEYAGFKNGDKDDQGRIHYRVYATKSDHKNKEFESLFQDGNVELIKDMADKYRDRFVSDVLTNRPGANEEEHCHGDTWDASEVVGSLIDGIKTFDELVDHIVGENEQKNLSGGASSTSNSNNQNQISMKNYAALVALFALAGLSDLELDADGELNLNAEQLTALNSATEKYNSTDVAAITTERDNALAAQATAEGDLATANTEHETALATANTRIAELEGGAGAGTQHQIAKADGASGGEQISEQKAAMDDAKSLLASLGER